MKTPNIRLGRLVLAALMGLALAIPSSLATAEEKTGEQIYRQQCASCHGDAGEGNEDYKPLVGKKSIAELAKVIDQTMPESDPEMCVGEDAQKVAAYIYEAFYSEDAQLRNQKPRIELSRLTVRQYQNAVTDLVGGFRSPGNWNDERGLKAEYYNDRRLRGDKRVIERVDATVDFHFGETSPEEGKIGAEEFSIRWEGGVLAPDTGEYEIVVRTENAFRLWVNNNKQPLIDAWVKSGDGSEYREPIFLIGGRVYPLKLEYFKSKQEKTASVVLEWKPPQRAAEPIPQRHLSPNRFPELFVLTTAFPPDDRSRGYERGSFISKEWDQATTYAAIETARYVAANLDNLAGTRGDAADQPQKIREFCRRFVERAFRRPLSEEQKQAFVDRYFDEGGDADLALKKVLLLALKSPRFLYRELGTGPGDAYDVASRLSFTLWDSLPDQKLLDAAANNQLSKPEQVAAQAERMLQDLRTRSKVRGFLNQWLRVDYLDNLAKDRDLYPDFNEQVVSDLRTSLDLFLEDVVWSEKSDFRDLLLADTLYVNGRLAKLYGADLPADAAWQKVSFDPQQRAGVLSHPFLLTGFAYHATSSPIHRGVFVSRSLLGRTLRPPPVAVSPLAPDLHADLSTRERVALQTSPTMCQSCHTMINPLGFSLEHYDAIGRYRTEEKGRPIDASGSYQELSGKMVEFQGVRELADFLAGSNEAHTAFVEQVFHHLVKQPIRAYADQPHSLHQTFVENQFSVQRLLVSVAATAALPPSPAE